MAIIGKYFPSQAPLERVFLVLRRSVFTYISFLLISFVMMIPLIATIIISARFPDLLSNQVVSALVTLAGSAYMLFILGLLLYGFVDYYLDVYIITDERIVDIKQIGFFRRVIAELHLREVQDVSARVKGFFPTLFHFGDVFIQTAGERENFIFQSVPHPYQVSKKIADLHEAQVEQERIQTGEAVGESLARAEMVGMNQNETSVSESPKQISAQIPEKKISDIEASDDGILEDYAEESMRKVSSSNVSAVDEHFSDRGISKSEALNYKASEDVVEKGLQKIDEYVSDIKENNPNIETSKKIEPVELKEGEVKNIYDN